MFDLIKRYRNRHAIPVSEKIKKVVCAVLYRYREKWTSKVIVTDVTGSMYPYMEELGLWHALEFMKEEKNTYIFFNDGDNKPDNEKIIGKTGGIYSTQNNATDTVVSLMYKAMNKGFGGDAPENNIEALLVAEKYAAPNTEIVMIADNYSAIKDINLLSKLTKPVHIILCGTSILQGIHPNYLWLAYKTHGSVHTIEEDIMNLSELVQGKIITIGGSSYKLLGNRFFEIK